MRLLQHFQLKLRASTPLIRPPLAALSSKSYLAINTGIAVKHIWRLLILWFVLGMCYVTLELLFRGYTYRQMIWIGGLCGLFIGLLNQHKAYYNRLMWQQCFLGTLITLAVEFAGGCIFNLWLHIGIWDYSSMPYNLLGQICLQMAVVWFFLMPFAIYADDWLRWKLFNEPYPSGGLLSNYIKLFTLH